MFSIRILTASSFFSIKVPKTIELIKRGLSITRKLKIKDWEILCMEKIAMLQVQFETEKKEKEAARKSGMFMDMSPILI
jgi:hypothetical protein